jgi:hypothetical protein
MPSDVWAPFSRCLQEWRAQLRSSLHPALFAAVYQFATALANLCQVSPHGRAELLIAAPKVAQALFAALLDCYTWALAQQIHGRNSRTAWATVCSRRIKSRGAPKLILSVCYGSLRYRSAVHGIGSARRAPCPIASRQPSRRLPSATGLGNGLTLATPRAIRT